ncbi:uncharacterized protein LOC128160743 [Crassostrea angulata]|uniref:uncharacterized protein LOC128160743 n=1 Tax=Magallana angulata TaxID=2784310 RepID=UPI0022B1F082|nr:uncharacterized protein LOC128160743 [Crassostrea angulata]
MSLKLKVDLMDEEVNEKSREPSNGEATSKEEDKREVNRGVEENESLANKNHCKEAVIEEGDDHELSSGDDRYVTCVEVLSGDESKAAKDNEITREESASCTGSYELGETSNGGCGTSDEKGSEDGTQLKEMPGKSILMVKLKTEKKNVQSAILEVRPETIGVVARNKSVTLNVREKDSKKKEQDDAPPPPNPAWRLSLKIKEETEITSPGRRLLENVEVGLQEDKFTPKRGDQHMSHFRHQQTVGQKAETKEWQLDTDDIRYGVHRTYSDQPPPKEPGCWTICKVLGMDLCCCCLCTSPPDPYFIEEVEDDKEATWQEERSENGQIKPDGKDLEDFSFNDNLVETKPKRVGRMKRIRRFFKRLFCCTSGQHNACMACNAYRHCMCKGTPQHADANHFCPVLVLMHMMKYHSDNKVSGGQSVKINIDGRQTEICESGDYTK